MPAPRMPWEPEPPQPAISEDVIAEITNETIPDEDLEEEED